MTTSGTAANPNSKVTKMTCPAIYDIHSLRGAGKIRTAVKIGLLTITPNSSTAELPFILHPIRTPKHSSAMKPALMDLSFVPGEIFHQIIPCKHFYLLCASGNLTRPPTYNRVIRSHWLPYYTAIAESGATNFSAEGKQRSKGSGTTLWYLRLTLSSLHLAWQQKEEHRVENATFEIKRTDILVNLAKKLNILTNYSFQNKRHNS